MQFSQHIVSWANNYIFSWKNVMWIFLNIKSRGNPFNGYVIVKIKLADLILWINHNYFSKVLPQFTISEFIVGNQNSKRWCIFQMNMIHCTWLMHGFSYHFILLMASVLFLMTHSAIFLPIETSVKIIKLKEKVKLPKWTKLIPRIFRNQSNKHLSLISSRQSPFQKRINSIYSLLSHHFFDHICRIMITGNIRCDYSARQIRRCELIW